jgi:hypothetical protein
VNDRQRIVSEADSEGIRRLGLREELVFLGFLVALMTGIGLFIVAVSDMAVSRALTLAFIVGGGVVVVGGFLDAVSKMPYWYTPRQRTEAFRMSYVYAATGIALMVVGIVVDSLFS